ncbi:hypothetical protein PCYB_007950, partial [Plasmodium cynomolgi strain B]
SFLRRLANDLPSGKFYYDFKRDKDNLGKYFKQCKELKPPYDNKPRVRVLCMQVLKYLKTKYDTLNNEDGSYDVCVLLNYAAFTRLHEIFGSDDITNITLAWASLIYVWNSFVDDNFNKPLYKKCKPIDNIFTNDWHIRKILYDYFVDYDTIKKNFIFYNDICQKYYMYLEIIIDIYKYFNKFCVTDNKDKCPDFYNKCKEYDPSNYIHEVICFKEIEEKKSASVKLKLAEKEKPQSIELHSGEEFGSLLSTKETDFSDNSTLQVLSSDRVKTFGNVLLGLVVTSMTSGVLYKVKIH